MNQKPSDLLLSVLDFFGILIPGAVFVFLHGDFLLSPLGLSIGKLQTPVDGVLAFFVAFVLGSFLHGFSDILDRFTQPLHSEETKRYLEAVRDCLTLPPGIPKNFTNVFYSVFSFIRINNSYALAELERQAGEYKMFRSLTFLFLLDVPLSVLSGSFSLVRLASSLLVVCLAAYRFLSLRDWTYRLASELYRQIREFQEREAEGKSLALEENELGSTSQGKGQPNNSL